MLEHYIQILESFKEHQLSILLQSIREKIIAFLESEQFSKQAQEFFNDVSGCRLMLMSTTPTVESIDKGIKAAYILTPNNKLFYLNRELKKPLNEIEISSENYKLLNETLAVEPLAQDQTFKVITRALSGAQLDIISKYAGHEHIAKCRLFLQSEKPKITDFDKYTHKAYILTTDHKLYYFNRALPTVITNIPITKEDYEALKTYFSITSLENNQTCKEVIHGLSTSQLSTIIKYSGHQHIEDDAKPPFKDFAHQPKQVVQLKEVINALYHAELAFRDLETVNLRDGKNRLSDLNTLYNHTIEHGYRASYLLTHLDVDIQQIFSEEIALILKLLSKVEKYAEDYGDKASKIAEIVQDYPISYTAGNIAGIATDQMQPHTGSIDYNFLAQFSAVLPKYIQQLTEYIHKYTNQITDLEPTLDKTKINELEDNAIKLLQAISDVQSNTFLFTFKGISYLHIIQHVTMLALSTLEQMGHMSDETQDVIRDNLSTLKYDLLVKLFAIVDKIEDETLLTPGTLSTPLMQAVVPFYQLIIKYASKPVDFSVKGKELLTLEDPKFIKLRIEKIQQRTNSTQKQLFKTQEIRNAFHNFFATLENYKNFNRIIDLPEEVKKELYVYYSYIQGYFEKTDVDLHNEILRGLQNATGSRYDQLRNVYLQFRGHTTDHLNKILNLKSTLKNLLNSDIATCNFHIKSNKLSIDSIYEHADLTPCPIELTDNDRNLAKPVIFLSELNNSEPDSSANNSAPIAPGTSLNNLNGQAEPNGTTNINQTSIIKTKKNHPVLELLNFNEPAILNLNTNLENDFGIKIKGSETIITKYDTLTAEQSLDLLQFYKTEQEKISEAQEKFTLFLSSLNDGQSLADKSNKKELSRWYTAFQPYLLRIFLSDKSVNITYLDKLINLNLESGQSAKSLVKINKSHFNHLDNLFTEKMADASAFCTKRIEIYQALAKDKFKAETDKQVLKPNYIHGNRAHYLIKHTNYSKAIAQFRQAVFNLTELFSEPLAKELKGAKSGLPFPELETQNGLLTQSEQVLTIKQIYNSLYHLEQICLQLEALDNKSSQSIYVMHLIKAYNSIDEIYKAAQSLYSNPYLTLLAQEIIEKTYKVQQEFLIQTDPYSVDPDSVTEVAGQVKRNSIWYTLQAFMLIPVHIKALSNQKTISQEELEKIQGRTKEITLKIERIISKSDSYFKLLLETPTMYGLFKELKQKLAEFTTTTHHAVVDNIREINTVYFTKILIETDKWEDKLGLKPGLLSGPMKEILDEFYRGLTEPLGFNSDNYFDLITDITPFVKRKEACQKISDEAQSKINANDFANHFMILQKLAKLIEQYSNFTTGPIPPAHPLLIEQIGNEIIENSLKVKSILQEQRQSNALKDNQPLLEKLDKCTDIINIIELIKLIKEYQTLSSENDYVRQDLAAQPVNGNSLVPNLNQEEALAHSQHLKQQLINHYRIIAQSLTKQKQLTYNFSPGLTESEILQLKPHYLWKTLVKQLPALKTIYSYYEGIYSTYRVTQEVAFQKKEYLNKLETDQIKINEKIKQDYIQSEIKKRIQIIINQQTDLINLNGEYNQALEKDLLNITFQEELFKQVYNESDIKLAIKTKLMERSQAFKLRNLDTYAKLDYVLTAITDFQIYLRKANDTYKRGLSVFEDEKSLRAKKAQINILLELAQKKRPDESVEERFNKIRNHVDTGSFRAAMLTYRKFDYISFNWLINCFLSLLQALHLYKPTSLKCFEQIKDAVSDKPKNIPRYGFFIESAREQQRYNLPFKFGFADSIDSEEELPEIPSPQTITV
ncbi:hypothetical protein ACNVED_13670 [Legionella sp. D16C41]|uniref:hypothetical protein n=1 Tax=Legionella sp. D16C41 TaxID=3402688 RepID=UPI003AF7A2C3